MGLEIAAIVLAVVVAAGAGWRWAARYRPMHKRDAITPRHLAVSVPRLGSMNLADELTVRGADDRAAIPAHPGPWTLPAPPAAVITSAALADPEQEWVDPMLSRLVSDTGEIRSFRLLAEVTSEMTRMDRDAAEFMAWLAAQAALARLHLLPGQESGL